MDEKEEVLQLEKIDLIRDMVFWLQRIAWNTSTRRFDLNEYITQELAHARSKQSAAEIHGSPAPQKADGPTYENEHERKPVVGVRSNAARGASKQKA